MTLRASAIALTVLAALLLAAGCGSSSSSGGASDAFKAAFFKQLGPLHAVGGQLTVARQAAARESDATVRQTFGQLAQSTAPIVQGLAALKAPARYQADVRAMHDALARARQDLLDVAHAAGAHRPQAVRRAFARLTSDSVVVKTADERLSAALGIG